MNGLFAILRSNLFILAFFTVFVSTSNGTFAASSPLVLKLIHPSKIVNPSNPIVTLVEQVQREKHSSMARYAYLQTRNIEISELDVIQGRLTAEPFGFYVNFSIGEPPVSQLVLIDTGSSLLWVQCLPCVQCLSQENPYYDPSKSSTYSKVLAASPDCLFPQSSRSNSSVACSYDIKYADNSSTKGEVSREKLTFPTSEDGIIAILNLVFGCGHENYDTGLKNGILGLDASLISLVTQLGNKFSYCLGNLGYPNYEYNQLILGNGAIFEGDTTPFLINRDLYYLTLEGITIGDQKLDINPSIFELSPEGKGGVIIDSGTFFTFLARTAYNALVTEVERLLGNGHLPKGTATSKFELLCYKGLVSRDLEAFPVVRFQFSGALIEIDYEGIFYQDSSDVFCMAVTPVDDYQMNIIGLRFQQYFNVGYDLLKNTLYFQRIDCQLLES